MLCAVQASNHSFPHVAEGIGITSRRGGALGAQNWWIWQLSHQLINRLGNRPDSAFGSPYNEMTRTRLAIIVAIKPSMEYATLCISIR